MIEQFDTLTRVKQLREDRALRALRTKQSQVENAKAKEAEHRAVIEDSAAALPGKIKKIYDQIMGQIVDLTDIDATKEEVRKARLAHQALEDDLERFVQIRLRLEDELHKARLAYQTTQRETEKFSNLASDLKAEAARQDEARAEIEIEELFSKGQALPA